MFMLVLLKNGMFWFIKDGEIKYCEINQGGFKFTMLYCQAMEPRGNTRPNTTRPGAANDDMEF
jgi:hypothetical protein